MRCADNVHGNERRKGAAKPIEQNGGKMREQKKLDPSISDESSCVAKLKKAEKVAKNSPREELSRRYRQNLRLFSPNDLNLPPPVRLKLRLYS